MNYHNNKLHNLQAVYWIQSPTIFQIKQRQVCFLYEFEGLDPPKSRESANGCLISLIEQLKVALDELHSQSFSHMDVCLPNICYNTRSSNPSVKLIDLDRCEAADDYVTTLYTYKQSDMYTPPEDRLDWQNYQLDWKAVSLIICYVLDEGMQIKDYHNMMSGHKVTNGVHLDIFVKCLLDEGYWNDSHYGNFGSRWLRGCDNPL